MVMMPSISARDTGCYRNRGVWGKDHETALHRRRPLPVLLCVISVKLSKSDQTNSTNSKNITSWLMTIILLSFTVAMLRWPIHRRISEFIKDIYHLKKKKEMLAMTPREKHRSCTSNTSYRAWEENMPAVMEACWSLRCHAWGPVTSAAISGWPMPAALFP